MTKTREGKSWIVKNLVFSHLRTIYRLKNPVNKKHQRMLFKNITFHPSFPTHSRFRPDEGLLNISVNRNRRCFKSQRSGAEVCARTKLRDVQSSVLLHTQRRAVNYETCCSHAAVYLWTGFSPSRGTRGAPKQRSASSQTKGRCDFKPPQFTVFINWDQLLYNLNLRKDTWRDLA